LPPLPPPPPPQSPPRYSLRRARPSDLDAVTSLHGLLEVPYEATFLSDLCNASPGGATFALVVECSSSGGGGGAGGGSVVAVLSARVEWSARGVLAWLGAAAAAAAAALARVLAQGGNGDGETAVTGAAGAAAAPARRRGAGADAAAIAGGGHPGYILTLAVAPAHRGRGLAAALLAHAITAELAAARGCDEISLHCLASNATARRLYARSGFVQEGPALPGYYFFGGHAHDGVLLVRRLATAGLPATAAAANAAATAAAAPQTGGGGGGGGGGDWRSSGDVEAAAPVAVIEVASDDDGLSRGVWALFSSLRLW